MNELAPHERLPAPIISVVVACYDQAHVLGLTLESFLSQDMPFHQYEIIVVDDASPNHEARVVVGRMRAKHPGAQVLYFRQNRADEGHYGASAVVKNIGVRLAVGRYVFFNNAEICQAGQSLNHILYKMAQSDVPLCLRGRVIDKPFEDILGLTPSEREALHDKVDLCHERVASADHAGLAAIDRSLLIQVGGNDERFDYWGKEDLDLAARLKRASAVYVYDENLKSFHISHPQNHLKDGDYLRMCALLEDNNTKELLEANAGKAWGTLNRAPREHLDATIILHAQGDNNDLFKKLEVLYFEPGSERLELVVVCQDRDRSSVEECIHTWFRGIPLYVLPDQLEPDSLAVVLKKTQAPYVVFSPARAPIWFWRKSLATRGGRAGVITNPLSLPLESARQTEKSILPLGMSRKQAKLAFQAVHNLGTFANGFHDADDFFIYKGVAFTDESWASSQATPAASTSMAKRCVMALVPYYNCAPWLDQCLRSLVSQTRPLDHIVVIADGDSDIPESIVRKYEGVTLLKAHERSGPYRLVQTVIDHTNSDFYMFQDADDWSSCDRLQILLSTLDANNADMVGTQEIRIFEGEPGCMPVAFPLDVNKALDKSPGHPLLHPTSIVSRDLIEKVGGFATGLQFGGDTEFLLRAGFMGKIVNAPFGCYFRRIRQGSLTTSPDTGLDSAIRKDLTNSMKAREKENRAAVQSGEKPDLTPMKVVSPAELEHICGTVLF